MATHVTISYRANATGAKTATELGAAMAAASVPVPPWLLKITGAIVEIDNVTVVGNVATRSVRFGVASPTFQRRFGKNPTRMFYGVFTGILRAALNQPVNEDLPVAT